MPPETKEKPAAPPAEESVIVAPPVAARSWTRTIINGIVGVVLLCAVIGAALFLSQLLQKGAGDDARSGRKFDLGPIEVTYWGKAQQGPFWIIRVEPTLELNPDFEGAELTKAEAQLGERRAEIIDKMRQRIRGMPPVEFASNDFDKRVKEKLLDLVNGEIFPNHKIVTNVWISKNPVVEQRAP